MNNKEMMIAALDAVDNIRAHNEKQINDFSLMYEGKKNNEETQIDHDMYVRMLRHELLAQENAYIKKEFDKSKKELDLELASMGIDSNGKPGEIVTLFSSNNVRFVKKQNKNGNTVSLTDFMTELTRLGVNSDTMIEAHTNATKDKRGNVYYLIEIGD